MTVPQGTLCSIGALDVRSCRGRSGRTKSGGQMSHRRVHRYVVVSNGSGRVGRLLREGYVFVRWQVCRSLRVGVGGAAVAESGSWERWRGLRQDVVRTRRGDSEQKGFEAR
jgi:hypothetical protein